LQLHLKSSIAAIVFAWTVSAELLGFLFLFFPIFLFLR